MIHSYFHFFLAGQGSSVYDEAFISKKPELIVQLELYDAI